MRRGNPQREEWGGNGGIGKFRIRAGSAAGVDGGEARIRRRGFSRSPRRKNSILKNKEIYQKLGESSP